jgi:predicted kinase
VILDWNQWSRQRRREWRGRAESAGVRPVLHYVRVPLEVAIARATARTAQRIEFSHDLDAAAITHLQALFEVPTDEEGIEVGTIDG